MKKLNLRKLRWIVREMRKGEQSVYRIARTQKITPRWVRTLAKRFKDTPLKDIRLKEAGRKAVPVPKDEIELVRLAKQRFKLAAVNLETILDEKGVHLPHNKIHGILKNLNLAKTEPKKSKRRKWIRYERRHSNSLWHTDWFEYRHKQCIIYEDDASRYIVGHGMFSNATTDHAIEVFDASIKENSTPRQVLSDHGTQFSSDDEKIFRFKEHLKTKGVELIKARIKHPQTNGKLEKLNHTLKLLLKQFDDDLDRTVKFYNHVRPHMSLYNSHTRTPYQAYQDKRRKKNAKPRKKHKK